MTKPEHNIEQLFQESETSKSITPPSHVWERIENKIEKKSIVRRVVIYKYVSIAAIGLCLLAVGFLFSDRYQVSDSSFFIEDLSSYHTYDKTQIDYYANRKILESYIIRNSANIIF